MAGKSKFVKSELLLVHRYAEVLFGTDNCIRKAGEFATRAINNGHGVTIEVTEQSRGFRVWECKEVQMIREGK